MVEAASTPAHTPLSERLAGILTEDRSASGVTLNQLLERTQGRGVYLLMIVLCLPFVVPASIPGLSTIMGAIVCLLAAGLARGRETRLPRFLGERPLPAQVRNRVLNGSVSFLRFLERFVKPRGTRWLSSSPARLVNCGCLALLGLLLALPLPAPPFFFSNSIPSYAIIVLAASMMEEDGLLIWPAYGLVLVNAVFFGLLGGVLGQILLKLFQQAASVF